VSSVHGFPSSLYTHPYACVRVRAGLRVRVPVRAYACAPTRPDARARTCVRVRDPLPPQPQPVRLGVTLKFFPFSWRSHD